VVVNRHYGSLCSELYDLTKPIGGHYPDVPYYRRRLTAIGGRVLEAAVGTGRLLVPLLQAGLHVEGIDSSAEMLTYCRRNCTVAGVEAALHCGALETMDLPHRYAAIVISLGSFMTAASHVASSSVRTGPPSSWSMFRSATMRPMGSSVGSCPTRSGRMDGSSLARSRISTCGATTTTS
jgi:SAM-dependent methyltransferase